MEGDCFSCKSLSGERRISPGPTIYEGEYWLVEHAYPCATAGWLVLVLKRHAEALHELSEPEFIELSVLQRNTATVLHRELQCEKEYMAFFAEAANFSHVHIHMVAKAKDLPDELRGPAIFRMLKVTEEEAVSRETISMFCERLQVAFATEAKGIEERITT